MSRLFVGFLWLMCLSACQKAPYPDEVARQFWTAVQENDSRTLKQNATQFAIDEQNLPTPMSFELGRIIIDGKQAEIETKLVLETDDSSVVSMSTYLVQIDGIWKVDFDKTMKGLQTESFSDLVADLSRLGERLTDDFRRSLEQLNENLPNIEESISEFEQKLEEGVPEFRDKIQGLIKQLQELLEQSEKNQPHSPDDTVKQI